MLLPDFFKEFLTFDCQCLDDYLLTKTQGPVIIDIDAWSNLLSYSAKFVGTYLL